MTSENEFLLLSFLTGIYVTFVYDLLRIFRRVIPQGEFMVSLEDMIFWVYCALKVFLLMYHESNGTLRWFAVFGALVGMFLYRKLVSSFFVEHVSRLLSYILCKVKGILNKILCFFMHPVIKIMHKMYEKGERAVRRHAVKMLKKREIRRHFFKKQLTAKKKMHNIET
ncbi:MAG: spore cortex biosynthesis protein YabQ [Lachnospiraceae bacterium]|nr:spore cortex biosynthesis protein YabQ [Lachnospiraceae bacterium]